MRSRTQARADLLGFLLYNVIQAVALWRSWGQLHWWQLFAAVLLGYVLADLLTGTLHWFFDTWGSPRTPYLGPVIAPFRSHHLNPLDIVDHGFLECVGNSCWAIMPLLVPAFWSGPAWAQVLSWTAAWAVQANLVHRAAHRSSLWWKPPLGARLYRLLWKAGWVVGPFEHDAHHVPPYRQNWCILAGWWNPPLNWLLPRIERGLTAFLEP